MTAKRTLTQNQKDRAERSWTHYDEGRHENL